MKTLQFRHHKGPVHGDAFIGREEQLLRIRRRVTEAEFPNPVSIVGLPRVGKSSLAFEATMAQRSTLIAAGRLPVWVNVGEYTSARGVLRAIVQAVLKEAHDVRGTVRQLERTSEVIQHAEDEELPTHLKGFFADLRKLGLTAVVVLEEFDAARTVFSGQPGPFQSLRELGTSPFTSVGLILVSRRPISAIEKACGISYLEGVVDTIDLAGFGNAELEVCRQAFVDASPRGLADDLLGIVHNVSGNNPYLLVNGLAEALELAGDHLDRSVVVGRLSEYLRRFGLDYFCKLREILASDLGLLDPLLGYFFGPAVPFPEDSRDRAERYGLIVKTSDGGVTSLSAAFLHFLEGVAFRKDLWPLWTQTERALRALVNRQFSGDLGPDWAEALVRKGAKGYRIVEDIKRRYQEKSQPGDAEDWLDFSYPGELFDLMLSHWHLIQPILKKKADHWRDAFALLSRVRNRAAHTRPISGEEQRAAQVYCETLLQALRRAGQVT